MAWWQKIWGNRAKAKLVKPLGDHIENLAAHPQVEIKPIGEAAGLPIWIDVSPAAPTTSTYDGLLWEVETMGEYLYYLAGDFPKNEKGLLRYESATTVAEVHVCFEDDVISVDRSEMQRGSDVASREATVSSDFTNMRVEEITSFAQKRSQEAGYERHLATLALKDLHGGVGYMEQANEFLPGPWVRLLWSKHAETSQGLRMTKIIVRSRDPEQDLNLMHDLFAMLIERYQNVEDHPLSGAIRISGLDPSS